MFGAKKEKQILIDLPENDCLLDKLFTIREQITNNGEWQTKHNWDGYAWTDFTITKEKKNGSNLFKVKVKCDYELSCLCPTIERAVQMACLYQKFIEGASKHIGWPTWVSKTQLSLETNQKIN